MSKRAVLLLAIPCLLTATLWAADDPLAGKWKLDPSRSVLTDEMKVEAVGANKYALTLGSATETIVADGTDQPGVFGTTLSVTVEGPRSWKVVRKKDGRIQLTGIWTLSEDGEALHDDFTSYQPGGSTFHLDYLYKRTEGTSGFAGTWESAREKVNSVYEIQIEPWEADGLSFVNSAQHSTLNLKFDGKDYPNLGPNLPQGYVSSARRLSESSVELSDKMEGKTLDTRQIELSQDGKTLTITVRPVGRRKPNMLVFERE